jgi:hypothetical protein
VAEKIKGEKLKRGLRLVFQHYGKIHKISIRKSLGLRGQAFVVYHTTEAAAAAVEKAQGFNFYGKPLVRRTILGGINLRESPAPCRDTLLMKPHPHRCPPPCPTPL